MADISQIQLGSELYNIKDAEAREAASECLKGNIVSGMLTAGETTVVISNENIKEDSILDFYSSVYGLSPKTIETENGKVTLTFNKAQENDVDLRVIIVGGES